jgi:outer membrane protein
MKTWIIKLVLILLAATMTPVFAGDLRIGVVDTERILRESDPALAAEKKIEKEFSVRDEEIKSLAQKAKDAQDFLDREGMTLTDMDRRNKERELDSMNTDLQRKQREFSEDLNLRKNEELATVLNLANKAIKEIAESEKFDLILQDTVYRDPKIDITDKVLKHLSATK